MKMKPYKEYKATDLRWLNEVPSHWEVKRGKNLFKREERLVREKDEVVTCFRDGEVTLRRNRRLDGFTESIKEIGYQGIRKGDLVIHQMDAFAGAVGVSDSDGKSTPVYSVCNGMVDLNNYYYAFIIREIARNGYIKSLSRGIRERSTDFRFSTFGKEVYPFPPKEEQDNIVGFLDNKLGKIDEFIGLKTRQIELLKEQKESMINKVMIKGLNDNVEMKVSGINLAKEIPMNWEIMPLKRIFNIKNGNGFPIELQGKTEGKYPFLKVSDINNFNIYVDSAANYLEEIDVKNKRYGIVPKNSVIIAKIGEALKKNHRKINNVACLIDNNLQALIPIKNNHNHIKYLYYLMKILDMNWFDNAGTVPSINNRKLMAFKVPIAPKMEQTQIVEFIKVESKKIDETIDLYQKEIDLIKEYKASLISSAVSGKIDLRDYEEVN